MGARGKQIRNRWYRSRVQLQRGIIPSVYDVVMHVWRQRTDRYDPSFERAIKALRRTYGRDR